MEAKKGDIARGIFKNKQAQVTVFIIIGIIILFSVAGILYVTKKGTLGDLETEKEPFIAEVPQQFQPLQAFTENCINQIGKRGLLILGEQGGYIYPNIIGEYSSSNPTDADGINLEPLKVPYWHYNKEPNTGKNIAFASLQPKLFARDDPSLSIEAQLARFLNEKIDSCLDNYNAFISQGFTTKMGVKETEVHVGENTVNFLLKMPVEAQKGEARQTLEQFYVRIPLRLKHYYEVANQVAEAQRQYFFLERQGMELISVYSGVSPTSLPPTSDVSYELFSPYSWSESLVKKNVQQLLSSYVPMLRFLGSENFYYHAFPEGELLAQRVSDNMILPLTGAEDLEVSFDYFGWEPYFKTNSDEGTIKPEHIFVKSWVLTFGQQRYETHYDVSYPVLITLHDNSALGGEAYTFVFALESNIRNNDPPEEGEKVEPYPRPISSLACAGEHKNSQILKTVVVDSFTKEPLEQVKIGFTIPEVDECDIGLTDRKGEVESKYPPVYGGIINFIHPEYLTNFYPINTQKYAEESNQTILVGYAVAGIQPEKIIEMHKIVTKKVRVEKKELQKCVRPVICGTRWADTVLSYGVVRTITCDEKPRQCFFNQGQTLFGLGQPVLEMKANESKTRYNEYYFINKAVPLAEKEQAIINLERVDDVHPEIKGEEFYAPITVTGTESVEVDLVPGIYKVEGHVVTEQPVHVPADERCFESQIVTHETQTCFTFEEKNLEKYVAGSIEWNTPSTYITITPEDLYTADEIVFSVLSQDLLAAPEEAKTGDEHFAGRVLEDLQVFTKLGELSRLPEIRSALNPRYTS